MRFREILLLGVLLVAGFVVYQVQTGGWDLRFDWDDELFGFGREYSYEDTRVFEAPVPAALEVVNGHGWVEVRGGDQDHIELIFKKIIRRRNEEDARDIAGRLQYTVRKTEGLLALGTTREEFRKRNFETGFILTVPRGTTVDIVNAHGPVRVESVAGLVVRNRHGKLFVADIRGPCILETSYQTAEVQDIEGDATITNKHAQVRVSSVSGDLRVETSYARARVEDVGGRADIAGRHMEVEGRRIRGPVTVETSYQKVSLEDVGQALVRARHTSVTAETVRGDLDVETSYQRVRAADIQGSLIVASRNGSVSASRVGGETVSVRTSYANVELDGFSAELSVALRNGNAVLRPLDLRHGMEVRNEHGMILLDWPSGEVARLEARTRGGSVDWGLDERPDAVTSNGTSVLKAFQDRADRPLVFLDTTYADIRVKEAGRTF
jgi:DUF4097 and DUF4098 domain-containing protein YvlB